MKLTSIVCFAGMTLTCLTTTSAQLVGPRCSVFPQPPAVFEFPVFDPIGVGSCWIEPPIWLPPVGPGCQPPFAFTVPVFPQSRYRCPPPSFWQPAFPQVWQPRFDLAPNVPIPVNRIAPQMVAKNPVARPNATTIPAANEIQKRVAALKRSTPVGRERADRIVSMGDKAFSEQLYARAALKYRDAIAKAPDYPEPHFRLAHVYVATRQYNLAIKSALTALELAGSSLRDGFSLAELYQGNQLAREKHDELLQVASLREPNDGGLQFLIGLTMHYGGNPLKGREHFRKAIEIPGFQQDYVRHFLPVVKVQEESAN